MPAMTWPFTSRPTTLNALPLVCSGTVAVQLLTLVQRTVHCCPFTAIVPTRTGAVPLIVATPLLMVGDGFTVKGEATVASCVCNPPRRWLNQFFTADGSVSGWLSHHRMPFATSERYFASITGLHLAGSSGPLMASSIVRQYARAIGG